MCVGVVSSLALAACLETAVGDLRLLPLMLCIYYVTRHGVVLLTLGALLHTDGPKCAMTPCLVRHQLPHRHCGDVALLTRGFALATAFALLFYVAIMFYCIHHSLPCSKRAWCDCVGSQTTATVSELSYRPNKVREIFNLKQ